MTDPGAMTLLLPAGDAPWGGGVFWSDLDESTADAAIAAAVERFRPYGVEFEWKHYGYDRPADLAQRLRAAGFAPEEEEALVVGEVDVVRERLAGAADVPGITVRRIARGRQGAGAGLAADQRPALDRLVAGLRRCTCAHWPPSTATTRRAMSVWLAESGDGTVVCAAWVRFHDGTDFASLWGGSTLEEYRRRGIYKALVARRADEAAERGFRFLQVDASPDSRPILERLGLRTLTSTTPYVWAPPTVAEP